MMLGPRDVDAVERTERERVTATEVSWALRELTRAAIDVDYALARRVGLRPMDFNALNQVFAHGGSLSPGDLSARLGISTGSATELIDRLGRAGHVERHRSEQDRRRVALQPTPAATELVLAALGPLMTELDDIARQFDDHQQEVITDYLRRVAAAMKDYGRGTGDTPLAVR